MSPEDHGIFRTPICRWFRVMWHGKEIACKERWLDACKIWLAKIEQAQHEGSE